MIGLRSCPVGDPTVGLAQSTAAVSRRPRRPAAHRYRGPVRRSPAVLSLSVVLLVMGLAASLVTPAAGLEPGGSDWTADHLVTADSVPSTGDRFPTDRIASARRVLATTSEGLAGAGAPVWHAAGFTGAGVKVAILDLGFNGLGDGN